MSSAPTDGTAPAPGRAGAVLSAAAVAVGCVLFLGAFVLAALFYRPYAVPTGSMAPTVDAGARVLAERIDGGQVRRGDVVVFEDAQWGGMPMIKRVVGVGGDEVACCDARGRLTVDGTPVDEPYVAGTASAAAFRTTVPEGTLFLLGDSRGESVDSRALLADGGHGAVPRDAVRARVDGAVWPLGSAGALERPGGFAALPGGVSEPGPLRALTWALGAGAALVLGGAAYGPVARRAGRRQRP
ncbi:signal peptidase I [Streptomyces sp. TRM 70351]|uniref:signal peptidase I n=1 Tax=Streptomyces sp. TRM 70351 TaxID=3116552 RepID=UPI002E7B7E49|nr:signal peptidase I [Streptomyces sp. TRM 70351]MEE1931135.1 signal peptidase I [Streptomyces sp. TRM 70351]